MEKIILENQLIIMRLLLSSIPLNINLELDIKRQIEITEQAIKNLTFLSPYFHLKK